MEELEIGCGKPTGTKLGAPETQKEQSNQAQTGKEVPMEIARVGGKAPDFQAPAYQDGKFGQVTLSDYMGKWVVLCFYPGDFTFV